MATDASIAAKPAATARIRAKTARSAPDDSQPMHWKAPASSAAPSRTARDRSAHRFRESSGSSSMGSASGACSAGPAYAKAKRPHARAPVMPRSESVRDGGNTPGAVDQQSAQERTKAHMPAMRARSPQRAWTNHPPPSTTSASTAAALVATPPPLHHATGATVLAHAYAPATAI